LSPSLLRSAAESLFALDRTLDSATRAHLAALAHGRLPFELARALSEAGTPEAIEAAAALLAANENGCACSGDEPPAPTSTQLEEAADRLAREAVAPFTRNPALREHLRSLGFSLEFPCSA